MAELPVITDQHEFNLKRWEEICADKTLAAFEFRIETDMLGQIIMSPTPAPEHGEEQFEIGSPIAETRHRTGPPYDRMPDLHIRCLDLRYGRPHHRLSNSPSLPGSSKVCPDCPMQIDIS